MTTVTSLLVTDNFNFTPASRPYTNAFTTDGQLAIGATAAPNIRTNTLTAGTGITITNGAGSITIAANTPESAYTLIQSVNTTSGMTATFTNASIVNYNELLFIISGVEGTNATQLNFTASNNGGSTYAVNFYGVASVNSTASASGVITNNSTPQGLTSSAADASSPMNGFITLYNPNSTFIRQFNLSLTATLSATNIASTGGGVVASSTQLNAFQFSISAGTFSAGNISLYGR